ncbi:hypothetical protein SLA_2401 [Streptomyces laurentii]|uniref:MerR family transcriptional regulator n=1 Tax=Streptomyces laurentii TaxID=39478 RepID=A0A169NEH2_STRLU|nr:hypothetical protein SLA_2401 [Streptomyces laurentii]
MNTPLIVDTHAAHAATGTHPGTIRQWLRRGHLTHHGHDRAGRALVDLNELRARLADKAA